MHALLAGLHLLAVVGLCDVGVGLELLLVPVALQLSVGHLFVDQHQRVVDVVLQRLFVTVQLSGTRSSLSSAGRCIYLRLAEQASEAKQARPPVLVVSRPACGREPCRWR